MEPSFSTGPLIEPEPPTPQASARPASPGNALSQKAKAFWITAFVLYALSLVAVGLEFAMWTLVDIWIVIVAIVVAALAGSASAIVLVFMRSTVGPGGRRMLRINPIELMGRIAVTSGPLFIAVDVLVAVNCLMDPSAGPAERIEVQSMNITKSDDSTNYNLHLRSWRPGEDTIAVTVEEETYRKIERTPEGKRAVMVEVRKGRLGLAWIGSVTAAQ